MRKIRVAAAGVSMAVASSVLLAFGAIGGSPVKAHPASVANFACVGVGNVGLCVGPPTAD